ncbi:hypothetical protein Tco_0038191 [Tanacetum coccineum]
MPTSNNSNNSNHQTLADSGANARPPMLEKGNYIPWESQFRRFLDNHLEERERMWHGVKLWTLIKDTMNTNLKGECLWESDITANMRHSRLMDKFDKFAAKEGESLDFVYERLATLMNIMDRNNVCPIIVAINTKYLNYLQPEWSKYVTMVRQNQADKVISYDVLYDSLVQFEPHVLASRVKKATKNHDPLALIAYSNVFSSHPHANSSYSRQSYYVNHLYLLLDYDDGITKGIYNRDSQKGLTLTTAMIVISLELSLNIVLFTITNPNQSFF